MYAIRNYIWNHIIFKKTVKNDMILSHFSDKYFILDKNWKYYDRPDGEIGNFKPIGLWLSHEVDDMGWKSWCLIEQFQLEKLTYRRDFTIVKPEKILHLDSDASIFDFDNEYKMQLYRSINTIDWKRVKSEFGGIVISPYQWACRNAYTWYYGFDVASACIWDLSTIEEVING